MADSNTTNPLRSSFPQNADDFDADERISFSKVDNKFILEAEDGQEFEFDDVLKRWVPAVRHQFSTTIDEGQFATLVVATT